MPDEYEEPTYGLVLPFIVCQTQGGPYEDGAFVAGVWFGRFDAEMEVIDKYVKGFALRRVACEGYVPSPLVPQLDLLAMHHGYRMEQEPWSEAPDEHTFVRFIRGVENPDSIGEPSGC